MQKASSIVYTFLAGFLLFFAWSGYIREEFKINEYRGKIVKKERIEKVISIGDSFVTEPHYIVFFEKGEKLRVPNTIYMKIKKGSHTVLMKQNENITLMK
ncbi:hypothetical protein P4V41_13700 [Fictibacillus nanhaiensis]|uniref:hypothetical protein n=1 Tax=Fictibacillus nanhaiensis TaxID=742169 RepID=UPI002E22C202|nr:hypothetical protein [Fictibacillus nanhaiensis]